MTTCRNYFAIYDRHRGPFTLVLTRTAPKIVKGVETIALTKDRLRGPFSAEDAHETARMIVGDPRDNVRDVFVFSESESQFIGAYYQRGQVIPSWDEGRTRSVADAVDATDPHPGQGLSEPAPVASQSGGKPRRSTPAAEGAPRRSRGAALTIGKTDGWPKSKGAQIVRRFFEADRRATTQEIVTAIGDQLTAAGIEFPASLVSRLKQAGFLTEAA